MAAPKARPSTKTPDRTPAGSLGAMVAIALAGAMALGLAACGDDALSELQAAATPTAGVPGEDASGSPGATESNGAASAGQADGGGEDTGVTVTADGTEYFVDTELGGQCQIDPAVDDGNVVTAYGYDTVSGSRVELTLGRQPASTSISGQDEYYGRLGIASGAESWQSRSTEPWPFAVGGAPVSGTLTMEDVDGATVDVTFSVDCP